MYELIITEKPSAAKKIAEALADGKPVQKRQGQVSWWLLTHDKKDIVVAAAAGHLFGVGEKGKRSYDYPVYDIEWKPNAEVDKGAAFSTKYLNVLKKLAKDADEITVATDYDIEGETIGLNIVRFLCQRDDANRMKFSTLTRDELREAYKHKQPHLDWGQAHAGETRHFLDWIYGINLSRALMASIKAAGSFKVLSIGRVQGPALKMVIDREREIAAFTPEPYWQLELTAKKDTHTLSAWHERDKFWDEDEARAALAAAEKATAAQVIDVATKRFKQAPPTPFDLGSLQAEAYRCFKIKPKETLEHAQALYTDGAISYPRTSSQKLPAKLNFKKILSALAKHRAYQTSAQQLLSRPRLTPNEGKKSDPAHPAIHPTGNVPSVTNERALKIYDLVVKRFLATFGDPASRETVTVTLDAKGERFLAKGTRTITPGWHELYQPYVKLKEEELPALSKDEQLAIKALKLHAKETQPPKRYTQASIISALEKRGLGTKATRADVVEALFKRNYVKGDANIEGTELGLRTIEALERHAPDIIDEALTRHFEEELEEIRAGKKEGEAVLEEAKSSLDKLLSDFRQQEKAVGEELLAAHREEREAQAILFQCPVCKHGTLRVKFSPKNKRRFIGCDAYPDCTFTTPLPQTGMPKASGTPCPSCGAEMLTIIRKGKRPETFCINPECPARKAQDAAQEELAKKNGEGQPCPVCKKGTLVLKKGRYGMFLGCDRYPKCKTIVNLPKNAEEQAELETQQQLAKGREGQPCPKCGEGTLTLRKSARGYFLGCSRYPKCRYIEKIKE